ncbi:F-box domain protein [Oesophagostomum dentatum]|uniref:F-box domain protein n=1 Tax=Oesophagostomum dentatum TaxID=61180 RepID=A0A0B1SZM1_OESDE|nr:F-box domain protein [Oesophagostomum dentatum]
MPIRSNLKRTRAEKASDTEFEQLSNIKFKQWNDLPREMKLEILQYLPFPDIRNFAFLSKECLDLAAMLRPELDEMSIEALERRQTTTSKSKRSRRCFAELIGRCVSAVITLRRTWSADRFEYCIYFRDDQDGVSSAWKYVRRNNSKDQSIWKKLCRSENETCCSAALRVFLHLMKFARIEEVDFKLVRAARVLQAETNNITDEELLSISAPMMWIYGSGVTSKGINGLIKQWLNGNRQIREVTITGTKIHVDANKVLGGLDTSVILSKQEFFQKPIFTQGGPLSTPLQVDCTKSRMCRKREVTQGLPECRNYGLSGQIIRCFSSICNVFAYLEKKMFLYHL